MSNNIAPLTERDVRSMGLMLGPVCDIEHVRGMKPHRHIESAVLADEYIAHACPTCGDVHVPKGPSQ